MSGTTIGQVSVNLRMSLAQFKQDVKDGSTEASRATKQLAQDMSANTYEARGTLALLGEEIGVSIPRHLRSLIAEIPGVGTALSAAFSSVAVLALIEIVAKIAEKIAEWKKQAEEVAESMRKTGDLSKEALHKLDEQILGLDGQIAELKGNYLEALLDKLKEIDKTTMDDLVAEFKKVEQSFDETLNKMKTNSFLSFLGIGDNKELEEIKRNADGLLANIQDFADRGDKAEVVKLIGLALQDVNKKLEDTDKISEKVADAYRQERDILNDQLKYYEKLNERATKQKEIEQTKHDQGVVQRLGEEGKAREELTNKVRALMEATQTLLSGERTGIELNIQKAEEELHKWQDLEAERQRQFPGIKTFYGEQIKAVQQKIALMREEQAAQEALYQRGIIPGLAQKAPNFGGPDVSPVFGGSSAQLQLEKIKTDSKAAQAELTKVIDATQDINTKFQEQSAVLEQLHKQYPEVFNEEMLKKAKDAIDPVAKAWAGFGQDIGDTIKQAALFGRDWSDALKSIAIDLVQVILKLTLMKTLSGTVGGGGFFGSLLGGLLGGARASGGPVAAGTSYLVGEQGPEIFTPDTSGTIIPNGAGGATVNNYFDARGADVAAIQRLEQLIERNKYESASMAVAAVRDQKRRS
jgi:hypothetical protein